MAILDVIMPQMSGPGLADAMRAAHFEGPIVFLTGYAEPDALRGDLARSIPVLFKPVTPADLARTVSELL